MVDKTVSEETSFLKNKFHPEVTKIIKIFLICNELPNDIRIIPKQNL